MLETQPGLRTMNQLTTRSTMRTRASKRPILSQFAFAGRTLPNRVVLAPLTRVSAGVEGVAAAVRPELALQAR